MAVKVKTFKGNRKAARGIERMEKRGYVVRDQSARKAVFSPVTGFFTRKQIHTITFEKP